MKLGRLLLLFVIGLPLFIFGFFINAISQHKEDSFVVPSFEKAHADGADGSTDPLFGWGCCEGSCCSS